jgi:hypothetical protein
MCGIGFLPDCLQRAKTPGFRTRSSTSIALVSVPRSIAADKSCPIRMETKSFQLG